MKTSKVGVLVFLVLHVNKCFNQNIERRIGKFREIFAWKQLTYNLNGYIILQDRFRFDDSESRDIEDDTSRISFSDDYPRRPTFNEIRPERPQSQSTWNNNDSSQSSSNQAFQTSTIKPSDEVGKFFIQYNNVPMGAEKVGDRLFITVPRRRYGIPSTLNYIDLNQEMYNLSPPLRPYPNLEQSSSLTSVYRTRADQCGRLWMVDTGLIEIPNAPQRVQQPAIVIFDLNTNRQLLRYPFKSTDLVSDLTPTGLASITVDITFDCADAYAYVPDLATYGLIVFSLRERDSWRHRHNYYSYNPLAGNFNIGGLQFQWNDGIFSLTLTPAIRGQCRVAYFHPLSSQHEFSVSTCVLKNKTANLDDNYWRQYSVLGERGENSQSTMHEYHIGTGVVFYTDVGRSAVSCWNSRTLLTPSNVAILAQDTERLNYPSDIHVTGDEVWVMANKLPRFTYSRLNTDEYNFFVYRANVQELISGTICAGGGAFVYRG